MGYYVHIKYTPMIVLVFDTPTNMHRWRIDKAKEKIREREHKAEFTPGIA